MQAEVNEFSETLASSSYGQYLARTTQQAQKTIDEVKARLQQTVALESAGAASDFSAAASARMFGRLTRQTVGWRPARLLCKRFNVAEPYVSDEPPASEHSHQDSHSIRSGHAPPPPPKSSFDEKVKALFASVGLGNAVPAPVPTPAPSAPVNAADDSTPLPPPPRPPIDLFRAIFADSDSDGDEVAPSRAPMASSVVPPAARPSVPTALPLADLKPTQPHSTPQSSAPQHPVASQSASARPQHDDLLGSIFGKGSVLTLSTDAPTQSANARADRMRDLSGTASTSASKDAALAIASRHTAVLQSQRAGGVAATTSQQSQNNRALEFLSSVLPSGTQAAPAPTMSAVSATGAPALQPTSLEELLRARYFPPSISPAFFNR
jgi:G patch domain-containing protein 1